VRRASFRVRIRVTDARFLPFARAMAARVSGSTRHGRMELAHACSQPSACTLGNGTRQNMLARALRACVVLE
jgi:hypothetical protein